MGGGVAQEPLARRGIAVPAVGPRAPAGSGPPVELRHGGGLHEHVPRGMRIAKAEIEPALLRAAEHRAARRTEPRALGDVQGVRAALASRPRTRVPRAVLPIVDDEKARE